MQLKDEQVEKVERRGCAGVLLVGKYPGRRLLPNDCLRNEAFFLDENRGRGNSLNENMICYKNKIKQDSTRLLGGGIHL
jgi:hypothetical protein